MVRGGRGGMMIRSTTAAREMKRGKGTRDDSMLPYMYRILADDRLDPGSGRPRGAPFLLARALRRFEPMWARIVAG